MDTLDLITLIIAIVGCITGILSLYISYRFNKFQKGKVEITTENCPESFYFNPKEYNKSNSFQTTMAACANVKIINNSAYAISIYSIIVACRENISKHCFDYNINYLECPINATTHTEFKFFKPVELPKTLNAGETIDLGIKLPFFEHVKSCNLNDNFKLIIKTSRKQLIKTIKIQDFKTFCENYVSERNEK